MVRKNIKKILTYLLIGFIILLSLLYLYNTFNNNNSLNKTATDVELAIKNAIKELDESDEKAEIISSINASDNIISLNFQGLSDSQTNETVYNLINDYNAKSQFFVTGNQAAENSRFIKKLSKNKQHISSNTLYGKIKMETLNQIELVNDFVRANYIIKDISGKHPQYLMANSTKYTDDLLRAAYVSDNKGIIMPSAYLNYQSFKNYDELLDYIKSIDKGSIIMIKMDGVLTEEEYQTTIKNEKPAEDKKPSENINPDTDKEEVALTPEQRLIQLVEWFLKAVRELNYDLVYIEDLDNYKSKQNIVKESTISEDKVYVDNNAQINYTQENKNEEEDINENVLEQLRKDNKGRKAEQIHTIYTTEKALSYTFYGIENREVLESVLSNLDKLNAKATFFVSYQNVLNNMNEIKKINNKGHELGIALSESIAVDYYSTLNNIIKMQEAIYDATTQSVNLVRYPYYVDISNEVSEAISSASAKVVWDDISLANSNYGVNGKEEAIINGSFGQGNKFVQRGYNIYYRMDYYKNIKTIPNLMMRIHKEKIKPISYSDNDSTYAIKSIGSLLSSNEIYNYPVAKEDILPRFRNSIYPNQLKGISDEARFNLILDKYVGNPYTSSSATLPGFTQEEIDQIDISGRFTNDKVLFLTFDDWSSDKPINQILYVLNKHNVKGNFYIRTNYMLNNPNILRAIAKEGHDIGNHSDDHIPLANYDNENQEMNKYLSLSEHEVNVVKNDLLTAQNKLISVVGDVSINNRPALTNILRPPTLAISRSGLEGVLDLGFDYILSGNVSTHDYEIYDPVELADRLVNGFITEGGSNVEINNGTVYIMHMYDYVEKPYDSLNVTAEALDIVIPILKSKGYSFARVSDYLE